jgi:hypothetical protein
LKASLVVAFSVVDNSFSLPEPLFRTGFEVYPHNQGV